jgi:UDP-N-acetylmuramate--alanine ligase
MGTGAQWTGGDWFVVEADESDGTHLELPLHGTILTNVEVDHLDHFGSLNAYVDSFDVYLAQITGPKVLCADDPVCAELAARHGAVTYGLAAGARYRAVHLRPGEGSYYFGIERDGLALGEVHLPLRGVHNVQNATGVVAMAMEIGIDFDVVASALARFGGVARRFDIRGHVAGATLVDDYAHLPTEIAVVLAAARNSGDGWKRIIAVFQPNRYNRMVSLSPEYRDAFVDADVIVLTEIFASGTTPIPGVTGKLVVNAVLDAHPRARVVWLPRRTDVIDFVADILRPGDVCISMGCGDIASLPDEVLAKREMSAMAAS